MDAKVAARKPSYFKMRAQMLEQGRTNTLLAWTDNMWATLKVYAAGGENGLHTHPNEDHTFIVLQGRARFHQPGQPSRELGRNEGILLPAGALYKFETAADEPLILLRVGNVWQPVNGDAHVDNSGRQDTQGAAFGAHTKANKGSKGVPIPGAFYE